MDNDVMCRICKSVTGVDLILSPCLCKGSLGYVHLSCLERWLNAVCRDYCELCTYQFKAIHTRRYNWLQSLRVWAEHPTHRSHIFSDLLIVLLLSTLTLLISAVCVSGIFHFDITTHSVQDTISRYSAVEIVVAVVMLMGVYIMTVFVIATEHVTDWYGWWNSCISVRLLIDLQKYQLHLDEFHDIHDDICDIPVKQDVSLEEDTAELKDPECSPSHKPETCLTSSC